MELFLIILLLLTGNGMSSWMQRAETQVKPIEVPSAEDRYKDMYEEDNVLIVCPLESTIDLESNCTVNASFNLKDFAFDMAKQDNNIIVASPCLSMGDLDVNYGKEHKDEHKFFCFFKVYDAELFDMIEISLLKEGDVIIIQDDDIIVDKIQRKDNYVYINNTYILKTDENGVYYQVDENDNKVLYLFDFGSLDVSKDCIIVDNGKKLTAETQLDDNFDYHFDENETKIVIENGIVVKVIRERNNNMGN